MLHVLYNLTLLAGFLLLVPYYGLKILVTGKYRQSIRQKLGAIPDETISALKGHPRIWIHAVSVGEVTADAPLTLAAFARERKQDPAVLAASLDRILERAGVTKGALYHHFANKTALGYAVLDEVILPEAAQWGARFEDPALDVLNEMRRFITEETEHVLARGLMNGCPINNLVQEMSPVDEGFRSRLVKLQEEWRAALERALKRAQKEGAVRDDVDPKAIALMLVASYEGCQSIGKCTRDPALYRLCMDGIVATVDALRVR